MRIPELLMTSGLVLACLPAAGQNPPAALINHTFEENDGGWTTIGSGATGKVSITHDAANVHQGKSAAKLDYTLQKGDLTAMILPVGDGALARAKSLRFWVKADSTAMLGVFLQEQDGGRYAAMFSAP